MLMYLINYNPFGDVLQRLFRGLKRAVSVKATGVFFPALTVQQAEVDDEIEYVK